MPEIVSTLVGKVGSLYLPFPQTGTLQSVLKAVGMKVHVGQDNLCDPSTLYKNEVLPSSFCQCDSIYFGTPTIVGGKPLFDDGIPEANMRLWSKESERGYVKRLAKACERSGVKIMLSGLGSGDITPEERKKDMGGADVVCFKAFEGFSDWLFARRLM